jgi:xanthine dehydrogenase small subunit
VEDFFTGAPDKDLAPGELIESIYLPLSQQSHIFSTYKVTKRQDCDIAAINAAFYLELIDNRIHQARVCYGGMSPYVKRAANCERALAGQPWTTDTIETAAQWLDQDFEPTSDVRASSAYRILVAKNLLRRFHLESALPPESQRVAAYQRTYE